MHLIIGFIFYFELKYDLIACKIRFFVCKLFWFCAEMTLDEIL